MTKVDCSKCCGTGKVQHLHVMGGVCFKCNGTGKQTKMKRVRVKDEWFSIESQVFNCKETAKTESDAKEIAQAWDNMLLPGEQKSIITPKSGYHYEQVPA